MHKESPTPEMILEWHDRLSHLYGTRNGEYSLLRKAFDGDFLTNQQLNAQAWGETTDEIKLTYNMINSSIRRYMDEMSAPIQPFAVPRGLDDHDIELAEKRQKLLQDILEENEFTVLQVMAAYNQALLDKAVFLVRPDPAMKYKVRIELVLPESYYPIPSDNNWFKKKGVIISWMPIKLGNWQLADPDGTMHHYNLTEPERVIEYWDASWYCRLQGNDKIAMDHDLGEAPIAVAHNIPIPHRERGQGDADQALGLNEYLNHMISDEAAVLAYLADPIVVVRGTKQGTGNLVFGPRAIWELERDASVDILTWAGSPPSFEAQILRSMQGIEDMTGISSPAYGRDIPSGVSGETIRSVLAGFNTRIGSKQTFMGSAINRVLNLVQLVLEKQFPNEKFEIEGELDGKAMGDAVIRPKEFKGWYKTQTIFQPQNETVRVFTEIEKMKNGVQSRYTTMKKIGITRPGDEYRRIVMEKKLDMMVTAVQGGHAAPPGEFGQAPGFAQRDPMQPQQPARDRSIQDIASELKSSNPGNFMDLLGVPEAARLGETSGEAIELADLLDILRDQDVSGRAWIEGKAVEEGEIPAGFTIRVEREEDIPQLRQALGRFASRAKFVRDDVSPRSGPVTLLARPKAPREE